MGKNQFIAVLYKEISDLRYNGYAFSFVMALCFFFGFSLAVGRDASSWIFFIVFGLILLPLQLQANLLVEEKEQQTWRVLQQQGISLDWLVLIKALPSIILTFMMSFFIPFLSGLGWVTSLLVCVFIIPFLLVMLSVGTIVAVFTKNKIEVALWVSPVVLGYFVVEAINQVLFNHGWEKFLHLLPNHAFKQGLSLLPEQPTEAFLFPFFYTALWAGGFIFLMMVIIRRHEQAF